MTYDNITTSSGYNCPYCGVWVVDEVTHVCHKAEFSSEEVPSYVLAGTLPSLANIEAALERIAASLERIASK